MLLRNLFEAIDRTGEGSTAVVGWGRGMGHKGHMMLASSVITKAKEAGGDPYFVVSRTVGKDDPLTPEEKLAIYKKVFPEQGHIFQAASDAIPDLTRVLADLNQQGYKNCIVIVGADQVNAFQYLKKYNGKTDKSGNIAFNFDNLDVISRQETNDPSKDQEGPRATPMRQALNDPNKSEEEQFAVWRDAMSPEVSDDEVRDLMNKAKTRMGDFAKPKEKSVAESFSQAAADKNKIKYQKAGKIGHGVGWKEYGDDYSSLVSDIVNKFDNITRLVQYDQASESMKYKIVERFFKKYGYPFELFNDVITAIERRVSGETNRYSEQGVAEGTGVLGNRLHYRKITTNQELVECAKKFVGNLKRNEGISVAETNHFTTACSTIFAKQRSLNETAPHITAGNKFLTVLQKLDQFKHLNVKVGSKVSIINTQFHGDYVELWGFATPKTITNIFTEKDGSIRQFEFNDDPDDVWPRTENIDYHGHHLMYSAFFKDKTSADHALTLLLLQGSENLNIHNHIEEGVAEDKDPCWDGYKQIGMKKKGSKQVPNCVPTTEEAGVGVIASKKQAKDPRYSTSLTKDVRPGQVNKNLKAFSLAEDIDSLKASLIEQIIKNELSRP